MKYRLCERCGDHKTKHSSGVCKHCREDDVLFPDGVAPGIITIKFYNSLEEMLDEFFAQGPASHLYVVKHPLEVPPLNPDPSWKDELPVALDVHLGHTDPALDHLIRKE